MHKSIAALILGLGLVCCAAAPAGVPRGANAAFNPIAGPSGLEWNWQRRVEHGCVDFSAADQNLAEISLVVRLSVDPTRCGGSERTFVGCERCGPGLWYGDNNYMFFQNYWPWTLEDSSKGMIFDSDGMWIANRPCPHSLTPQQLAALRIVAHEALAETTTDLERQALERIDQILAATNGAALESGQYGCAPERGPSPTE